ncbi:MAG: putative toxin-antitoxin system toxin component, PIN family [Bacteroidota bacterium]
MSTTAVKIVLDTNVFIATIGKSSPHRWIFDAIIDGTFTLCISTSILLEYEEVLQEKTRVEVADNVTNFLSVYPLVYRKEPYIDWNLIAEDPDDNKYVDCAVAADAFCIVSNDGHFKPYKNNEFPPLKVMTLREFEAAFKPKE